MSGYSDEIVSARFHCYQCPHVSIEPSSFVPRPSSLTPDPKLYLNDAFPLLIYCPFNRFSLRPDIATLPRYALTPARPIKAGKS